MAGKDEKGIGAESPFAIYSLELDAAGTLVGDFLIQKGFPINRRKMHLSQKFCAVTTSSIESQIASAIDTPGRVLAVYGSGWFHHYTYGLCRRDDWLSREFGYIHIDHHSDGAGTNASLKIEDEFLITAGGFVREIVISTNVKNIENVLLVGSMGVNNVAHIYESEFMGQYGWQKLERMIDTLPDDVYVTIDLDVMDDEYIKTDWEQGSMKLAELLAILDIIHTKKRIIGADICGLDLKYEVALPTGLKVYERICTKLLGMDERSLKQQCKMAKNNDGDKNEGGKMVSNVAVIY